MSHLSSFRSSPAGHSEKRSLAWAFVSVCAMTVLMGILALTSCQFGTDPIEANLPSTWEDRIEYSLRQVLDDYRAGESRTDEDHKASQVEMAASSLATAGQVDRALELVNEHITNERLKWSAIRYIAAAQSAADDLKGALATAALIPQGYMNQRTLALIAARQAQRGDFADACAMIPDISDAVERDNSLKLIIMALMDAGELGQAQQLLPRIVDPEVLSDCQKQIQDAREKPIPTDDNYTEWTVARVGRIKQLTQQEEQFLRLTCRAETAVAQGNHAARRTALESAHTLIADWEPIKKVGGLLTLAHLYSDVRNESGRARDLYRQSLLIAIETADAEPFAFMPFAWHDFAGSVVRVMDAAEIKEWIDKLVQHPAAHPLVGFVIAALVRSGAEVEAIGIWERLSDPECRLYVACGVISYRGASQSDAEL